MYRLRLNIHYEQYSHSVSLLVESADNNSYLNKLSPLVYVGVKVEEL